MAQGFVINALLNASKFIRGVKDMDDALDGLEGALEDAQEEVDRLNRDGEDAFDDLAKGADDAADEANTLEKRLRDVRDAAKDAGDAGDRAGKDMSSGFDRAKKGVNEFKDEANSTAREAAASFDGSAESIADAFQEVTANALGGFGPAGAVAGLAAAAGIGLAVSGFEAVAEAQAASEEAAAEWADAFIEAGDRVLGAAETVARVVDIATDPERFKTAQQNAKDWGVDISTALLAMSGNATAIKVVETSLDDLNKKIDEYGEKKTAPTQAEIDAYLEWNRQVKDGSASFERLTGEMEAGRLIADSVSDALLTLAMTTEGATVEVDELGNKVVTLPDQTQIFIDAETGQATQNVSQFKGDVDGIPEEVNTKVKVGVDSSAWDNWRPTFKTGVISVSPRFGRTAV